jgi:hypothetical protein
MFYLNKKLNYSKKCSILSFKLLDASTILSHTTSIPNYLSVLIGTQRKKERKKERKKKRKKERKSEGHY